MRVPPPPKAAGPAGRRLWREANAEYQLSGADLAVLRRAVQIEDQIEGLEPMLRLGPIIKVNGAFVANPASVQLRLLTIAMARTLAALRIIGDESAGEAGTRTQHRSGFRGAYTGLRSVE